MPQKIADITTDGERILAKIPYAGGQGKDWAHEVPGCSAIWDKSGSRDVFIAWGYPLTMDTCRSFRRVFGTGLTVRPALSAWARAAIAAGQALEDLRSGATARLSVVEQEAPFLAAALNDRKYQVSGAAFLTLAGQGILGDQPGLGKTLQTLAALVESDSKVILVSCPRTATRNVWERETERWAPGIATFVAQGTRAQREVTMDAFKDHPVTIPGTRKMLIINNEMIRAKRKWRCKEPPPNGNLPGGGFHLKRVPGKRKMVWDPPLPTWDIRPGRKGGCPYDHEHETFVLYEWPDLFEQEWDAVVIDEAHNLLASTYNVQSDHITQGRYGAMLLRRCVKPEGLALALSGTPFRSKLTKAWGTLNWCRPDVFGSYWNFAATHFGVEEGRHGKIVAGGDKVPKPLDQAAFDAAIRPYYLCRTKQEAAPDLPDIMYAGQPPEDYPEGTVGVWIDMEPKQAAAYGEMAQMAEANLENGTLMANGILAEITRLRQFAVSYGMMKSQDFLPDFPSAKFDWIMEFLEEREGCDGKVLISSTFSQIVNLFAAELRKHDIKTLTLTGATSDRGRTELVRRFNDPDDPTRVAIINSRAGGEAITLDKDCDDIIIIDPPWTSDEEEQLTSRIHRVSRIHQVTVYRLFSKGTVDEWMAANSDEQREILSAIKPKGLTDRSIRKVAKEVFKWSK